jgi:hypothetical protein
LGWAAHWPKTHFKLKMRIAAVPYSQRRGWGPQYASRHRLVRKRSDVTQILLT